jgi:hypothetical protein
MKEKKQENFRLAKVVPIFLCLAAGAVVAKGFWPKESAEAAAKRFFLAIDTSDSASIANLTTDIELQRVGATKDQYKRYLSEYLLPVFERAAFTSDVSIEVHSSQQKITATRNILLSDGKEFPLSIIMGITEKGPRAHNIGYALFLFRSNAMRDASDTSKVGRFEAFARSAEEDGPKLKELGINGVWQIENDEFLTWQELAEAQRTRAAKLKASLRQ